MAVFQRVATCLPIDMAFVTKKTMLFEMVIFFQGLLSLNCIFNAVTFEPKLT